MINRQSFQTHSSAIHGEEVDQVFWKWVYNEAPYKFSRIMNGIKMMPILAEKIPYQLRLMVSSSKGLALYRQSQTFSRHKNLCRKNNETFQLFD